MNVYILSIVFVSMIWMTGMSEEKNIVTNSVKNDVTIIFSDDKTSETFEQSKDKLAIVVVSTEDEEISRGSGFIIKGKDSNWLITNRHVVDSVGEVSARLLDGSKIDLGEMVVAENRDIVRFKVDLKLPALELDSQEPTFGDEIEVYGNSDGAGVVTRITGKVRGIGPDFVEVDAQFVSGNSGSPIVRVSTGKIIGIASFTKQKKHEKDTAYDKTRFNDVRWFGVRFTGIKWKKIGKEDFSRQVKALDEIDKYLKKIQEICFDGQWFRMDDYREMEKFREYPLLNRVFRAIAEKDEQLFEQGERLYEMQLNNLTLAGIPHDMQEWKNQSLREAESWITSFDSASLSTGKYRRQGTQYASKKIGRGSIKWIPESTINSVKDRIGKIYVEGTARRYSALIDGRSMLRSEQWCTEAFQDKVDVFRKVINAAIRRYKESNRRQLKKAGVRIY